MLADEETTREWNDAKDRHCRIQSRARDTACLRVQSLVTENIGLRGVSLFVFIRHRFSYCHDRVTLDPFDLIKFYFIMDARSASVHVNFAAVFYRFFYGSLSWPNG